MDIKEIKFNDVSHLEYNEDYKDHRPVSINDKLVYRVLVIDGVIRVVTILTNGDLPLRDDPYMRYFIIDGWGRRRGGIDFISDGLKDKEELQNFITHGKNLL